MNVTSDDSPDGLVEGVGQELTPASGLERSPLEPQDGQWTFRFNHADPTKVSVFVTVNFGPPFSLTATLSSEMNSSQVESLAAWVGKSPEANKGKP